MLFFWNNGFLRPLLQLGVWLFGNNENEVLTLDSSGERHVDAYGSDGSPFARLAPDLHGGGEGNHSAWIEERAAQQCRGRRRPATSVANLAAAPLLPRDETGAGTVVAVAHHSGSGSPTVHLCITTLRLVLEFCPPSAPLPLAVAAAGPRLRLAGEQAAVFYFPGAASCVRGAAGVDSNGATAAHARPCVTEGLSWWEAAPPATRRVRGTSLLGLVRAMRHSAWWYGRPAVAGHRAADDFRAVTASSAHAPPRCGACLPLCVEVTAPRQVHAASASSSAVAAAPLTARWWTWLRRCGLVALAADDPRSSSGSSSGRRGPLLLPPDVAVQAAVSQFIALVDQLWCWRQCAVVEVAMERCPVALAEWLLSPDLHPGVVQAAGAAGEDRAAAVARAARTFRFVGTLRCRGRGGEMAAAFAAAPTAAALPLSFTAVRPHLRVLDLSGSPVATLDGVEAFPLLEKILLTGCAQLRSLSPLGLAPALREIVASQSAVCELAGLARSPALVSLSLYGCVQLVDVSACGRIATLRDLFISESTVTVLAGLQASGSLARLGMRYCDVAALPALSAVSRLRVLHAASSTLASVAALQYCASLEVVEVAACGQLLDLGPLGLAPRLREIDASASAVRAVDGLRRSTSLEKLLLAQCSHLEDGGRLGQCVHLRHLSLAGTPVRDLDGLAGAPRLAWLDVRFCRQLHSVDALLQLPRLRQVMLGGCAAALRRPEELRSVVTTLRSGDHPTVVVMEA